MDISGNEVVSIRADRLSRAFVLSKRNIFEGVALVARLLSRVPPQNCATTRLEEKVAPRSVLKVCVHSVVLQGNRSLRLGMAGRGSGDTTIRFGWHVQRLRPVPGHRQAFVIAFVTNIVERWLVETSQAPGFAESILSMPGLRHSTKAV